MRLVRVRSTVLPSSNGLRAVVMTPTECEVVLFPTSSCTWQLRKTFVAAAATAIEAGSACLYGTVHGMPLPYLHSMPCAVLDVVVANNTAAVCVMYPK